jgi:5-formyltetrahydrofolate cyclo-ligase
MRERLRQVADAGAWVVPRVLALPEVMAATWVAGFVSFGTEVPTHELLRHLLAEGKHVCVPSFDPVGQRYICSELKHFDADLAPGKLDILEPRRAALRPVAANKVDVWLVPGLAFDEHGNRLGRGMGYFDQLLRDARGVKIGLAHDCQVVKKVPTDSHDVGMDWIVTETRTIRCLRERK